MQLELAVPIEDSEVLSLINKQLSEVSGSKEEKFLLFPALICIEAPEIVRIDASDYTFIMGWTLACIGSNHFFDARFLHVLLLRLSLSIGLAPEIDPELPSLQRQCSVWKSGICWSTIQGVKVVVEIVNKKLVSVILKAQQLSEDFISLRTSIIQKVLEAAYHFCPAVATNEMVPLVSDIRSYSFNYIPKIVFGLPSIAKAIVHQHQCVVSSMGTQSLVVRKILPGR